MELIADGLLIIAALTASLYCIVLSRRLRRLTQMEDGLGKAITDMSAQVDEMHGALARAKAATAAAAGDIDARLAAARVASAKLEAACAAANEAAAATALLRRAAPARAVIDNPDESADQDEVGEADRETGAEARPAPAPRRAAPKAKPKAARKTVPNAAPARVAPAAVAAPAPAVAAALGAALSDRDSGDQEALARRLIAALSGAETETAQA